MVLCLVCLGFVGLMCLGVYVCLVVSLSLVVVFWFVIVMFSGVPVCCLMFMCLLCLNTWFLFLSLLLWVVSLVVWVCVGCLQWGEFACLECGFERGFGF